MHSPQSEAARATISRTHTKAAARAGRPTARFAGALGAVVPSAPSAGTRAAAPLRCGRRTDASTRPPIASWRRAVRVQEAKRAMHGSAPRIVLDRHLTTINSYDDLCCVAGIEPSRRAKLERRIETLRTPHPAAGVSEVPSRNVTSYLASPRDPHHEHQNLHSRNVLSPFRCGSRLRLLRDRRRERGRADGGRARCPSGDGGRGRPAR